MFALSAVEDIIEEEEYGESKIFEEDNQECKEGSNK